MGPCHRLHPLALSPVSAPAQQGMGLRSVIRLHALSLIGLGLGFVDQLSGCALRHMCMKLDAHDWHCGLRRHAGGHKAL